MKTGTSGRRASAIAMVMVALVAFVAYIGPLAKGQPDQFTLGMATVITGYVMFPMLALLAAGLLLIAVLLFAAQGRERRGHSPKAH